MSTARLVPFCTLSLFAGLPVLAQELRLDLDRPDATWKGAVAIADGAHGGAAHFDGEHALIDAGACPVTDSEPFTLCAQLRTTHGNFSTPLMARDGDAVGFSLVIGRQPGVVSFEAWSWQKVKLVAKTRIDDGKWHAIEVPYDPVTNLALLFVDGVLEAAAELGHGGAPHAQLRLGDNLVDHQPFAGDLDEVQLLRSTTHAADISVRAAVVPTAESAAALTALRQHLLPKHTASLDASALPQWPARRLAVRAHVLDCLGLTPTPPRTELAPVVHGELHADGFVLQRVSWNSWQLADGTYRATGWLWLPDPLTKERHPAVLALHGHWENGVCHPVVQSLCAQFARLGWITLAVDTVHVENVAAGASSIGAMTWNNQRAIDLLTARSDVDSQRLAMTGGSGGAQQTYYLMTIEDRLAAAAPICMACYFQEIITDTDAHCLCNHLPRLAAGTDVPEMCAMFAPKPVFFGSVSGDWTHAFPTEGLPELQQHWRLLGAADRIGNRHGANEGHNYDRPMREAVDAFFQRTFEPATAQAPAPTEQPYAPFTLAQMVALGGPPPRTPPDAAKLGTEHLARRSRVASLGELAPRLPWQVTASPIEFRGAEAAPWRAAVVRGPDSVPVPFLVSHQLGVDSDPWLVVDAEGGKAELLRANPTWLALPRVVLVDPRCRGEWLSYAPFWRRNGLILGCGEGYQAAHDVAQVCESLPGRGPVVVVGLGAAGVEALLAAGISKRITKVITDDLGTPYEDDGNRLPFCPELLRFGGFAALAKVASSCELVLGGGARGNQVHADPIWRAPLNAEALAHELQARPH